MVDASSIPTSLGLKIKCLRTEHTWNREQINTLRLYLPKATKLRWNFLKDVLWKNFICYYNCPCSTFKPTIQLIKIYVDTQKLSFPFLRFINNALSAKTIKQILTDENKCFVTRVGFCYTSTLSTIIYHLPTCNTNIFLLFKYFTEDIRHWPLFNLRGVKLHNFQLMEIDCQRFFGNPAFNKVSDIFRVSH